ncbi:MAG: FliH/SctL family protein [Oscillospiraceae bacterium]|nr:FliH/SctL family protein [Oscillospiraceae bacterium]
MAKVIKAVNARIGEPKNPLPVAEEVSADGGGAAAESAVFTEGGADEQVESIVSAKGEYTLAHDAGAYQAAYDELVQAAQDEVAAMLEDARKDALAIMRESESHANAVREQAWEEGYGQAFEQAKRECEEMLTKARGEIEEALAKLPVERERMLDELETQMLDVSLEVAGKILHMELDRDNDAYLSMLRSAVSRMPAEETVTIRLSEEEYQRFFNSRETKIKTAHGSVAASLIADPAMNRYDAVIESPSGVVDAGAGAQLKQMRKNMGRRQ